MTNTKSTQEQRSDLSSAPPSERKGSPLRDLTVAARAKWREENAASIAAYNDFIRENGTYSDDVRVF
ncbi:MAG TPA: type II toxin-antitoxin system CcdA family antitoxin [Steroidobacteraceae bacterium]